MTKYNEAQVDFRERSKGRIQRQLEISACPPPAHGRCGRGLLLVTPPLLVKWAEPSTKDPHPLW